MKNRTAEICFALFFVPCICSAQDAMITGGLCYCTPQGQTVIDKPWAGFEIGVLLPRTDSHYMGVNFDMVAPTEERAIDIPANLLSDEKITTQLKLASLTFANRLYLTPNSRAKLFFDANIGFRLGKYEATHEGRALLFFTTRDKLYDKSIFGLATQFFLGFYFPLNKSDRHGLQFKTGLSTGTPVTYIKNGNITYTSGSWNFGEQFQSNATYWMSAVDFVWNLDRPRAHPKLTSY